jgi:phage gpG-like protein
VIRLYVNTSEGERLIETVATSLEDLQLPLQMWNKYFRQKVQEKFAASGPGWAPTLRAQATEKSGEATKDAVSQFADDMLRRKLRRELQRAAKKYARGSGSKKAMERRYAVLQEFERIAAGGEMRLGSTIDARLDKSVRGLRERHGRAVSKAQGKPLGRVASSIKSKLTKYSVNVFSEIPWSAVHNDGGVAGHGAKIPQRQFLDIDDDDVKMLAQLVEDATRFSL